MKFKEKVQKLSFKDIVGIAIQAIEVMPDNDVNNINRYICNCFSIIHGEQLPIVERSMEYCKILNTDSDFIYNLQHLFVSLWFGRDITDCYEYCIKCGIIPIDNIKTELPPLRKHTVNEFKQYHTTLKIKT